MESMQENRPKAEKWEDRTSNRNRQKNRADRNVESNDSPEIPDKGGFGTQMPSLPSQLHLCVAIYVGHEGKLPAGQRTSL